MGAGMLLYKIRSHPCVKDSNFRTKYIWSSSNGGVAIIVFIIEKNDFVRHVKINNIRISIIYGIDVINCKDFQNLDGILASLRSCLHFWRP